MEIQIMSEYTIKDLEGLLNRRIEKGMKITGTKMKALTAPGDNYGSTMLQLDVTLKNEKDGTEKEIHAVAKMIPELEATRVIFNTQVTFKNEIGIYNSIIPALQDFQRENGVDEVIDCVAEFYGARINLRAGDGIVDDDAVLIMENLKVKGYQLIDRFKCFDLETSKVILKDLAAFNAIPLALKLTKPEVFAKKIRPYLAPFRPAPMPFKDERDSMLLAILQESYKCIPWVPKIKNLLANEEASKDAPPREPFSAVAHGDMWINNMMVKFENGKPVSCKLLDFQVCDYRSAATDLFFFLFSSVQVSVLQDEFDNLIEFYYKHFISHLQMLKCDITQFSFPKFLEEIKAAAAVEIVHTMIMVMYIFLPKDAVKSEDNEELGVPSFKTVIERLDEIALEKMRYMVYTCGKKGWLE